MATGNFIHSTGYNKLGNQVTYVTYGVQRWRRYVEKPKDPKTAAQQLMRAKMAMVSTLAARFRPAIMLGLYKAGYDKKRSAYAEFNALNYSHISGLTPETLEVSLPALEVSKGNVPVVMVGGSLNVSTPNKVEVTITDGLINNTGADASDEVYAFAYVPAARSGKLSSGPIHRTDAKVAIENLPASWSGLDVYVYLFVVGGNNNIHAGYSSNTVYCGSSELA